MKLDRRDLLNRLLCVEAGISNESIQQSSCIVLRKGRFYTLNREIACSLVSGLDPEINTAVKAAKLIAVLKKLPDEAVEVGIEGTALCVRGKGRVLKVPLEAQVVLPVQDVKAPKDWQPLHDDFSEAVDLACRCTKRGADEFLKQCVHIHPKYLEASDNTRYLRYPVATFVAKPVLVRGESLKIISDLGMTKGAELGDWLHFRNPLGLRLSVKKFALDQGYPDFSDFLELRGRRVPFPEGLEGAAERAGIVAEEGITVKVSKTGVTVGGFSQTEGDYQEERAGGYDGPDLDFRLPAKVFAELVSRHAACEVMDTCLRVDGGKYLYVASLEA